MRIPTRMEGDPIHVFWAGEAKGKRLVYMAMARASSYMPARSGWVKMARNEHREYCKYLRMAI